MILEFFVGIGMDFNMNASGCVFVGHHSKGWEKTIWLLVRKDDEADGFSFGNWSLFCTHDSRSKPILQVRITYLYRKIISAFVWYFLLVFNLDHKLQLPPSRPETCRD